MFSCSTTKQPEQINLQYPQDVTVLLDKNKASDQLIDKKYQDKLASHLKSCYLKTWDKKAPFVTAEQYKTKELDRFIKKEWYGSNLQKLNKEVVNELVDNFNIVMYPSLVKKAITVEETSLRLLPFKEPFFKDPQLPGEGYPFDYLQSGYLPNNYPVLVTNISKDKLWALVETDFTYGWLEVSKLAYIDDKLVKILKTKNMMAVIKEKADLELDTKEVMTFNIGSLLFVDNCDKKICRVSIAKRGLTNKAILVTAHINRDLVTTLPFPITQTNISNIIQQLIGNRYGWGGLYGNRDCSSTVRDIYIPFGIWLRPFSKDQSLYGTVFDLPKGHSQTKEKLIVEKGVPYLSTIYRPGHISIYLGKSPDNKAIVLQDMWGIKTFVNGKEGRFIIGKTVVSDLTLGHELNGVDKNLSFLNFASRLTVLPPTEETLSKDICGNYFYFDEK